MILQAVNWTALQPSHERPNDGDEIKALVSYLLAVLIIPHEAWRARSPLASGVPFGVRLAAVVSPPASNRRYVAAYPSLSLALTAAREMWTQAKCRSAAQASMPRSGTGGRNRYVI